MEQNGRLSLVVVIASFSLDFICSSRTTSVLRTVPQRVHGHFTLPQAVLMTPTSRTLWCKVHRQREKEKEEQRERMREK